MENGKLLPRFDLLARESKLKLDSLFLVEISFHFDIVRTRHHHMHTYPPPMSVITCLSDDPRSLELCCSHRVERLSPLSLSLQLRNFRLRSLRDRDHIERPSCITFSPSPLVVVSTSKREKPVHVSSPHRPGRLASVGSEPKGAPYHF